MGDALDGREFYELMQAYRNTPWQLQDDVIAAFEEVKDFIREHVKLEVARAKAAIRDQDEAHDYGGADEV